MNIAKKQKVYIYKYDGNGFTSRYTLISGKDKDGNKIKHLINVSFSSSALEEVKTKQTSNPGKKIIGVIIDDAWLTPITDKHEQTKLILFINSINDVIFEPQDHTDFEKIETVSNTDLDIPF